MDTEKAHLLLQQLEEARDYLWGVVDALEPDTRINNEWTIRDFFAHIAGWEALVFEAFRDHVAGTSGKPYPYTNVDDMNRQFVNARQSQTAAGARLECEINRFAIETLIQKIPAAAFANTVQFPWGPNTVVEFIQSGIEHERDHADEIVKMKKISPS